MPCRHRRSLSGGGPLCHLFHRKDRLRGHTAGAVSAVFQGRFRTWGGRGTYRFAATAHGAARGGMDPRLLAKEWIGVDIRPDDTSDVCLPAPARADRIGPDARPAIAAGHWCAVLLRRGVAALALLGGFATQAPARCADLALVLAIDASGSIDAAEFALQQRGYAAAFLSSRVQAALAATGVVDISAVVWGDTEMSPQVLPWQRLRTVADAVVLSHRIAGLQRQVTGNTGIGRGVWTAIDLLEAPDRCAYRRLVNVSGDGTETLSPRPRHHVPLALARARADALGITINALAIQNDTPALAAWYQTRLIAGPGAFVITVAGFDSFAEAIIEKLAREIGPPAVAGLQP